MFFRKYCERMFGWWMSNGLDISGLMIFGETDAFVLVWRKIKCSGESLERKSNDSSKVVTTHPKEIFL